MLKGQGQTGEIMFPKKKEIIIRRSKSGYMQTYVPHLQFLCLIASSDLASRLLFLICFIVVVFVVVVAAAVVVVVAAVVVVVTALLFSLCLLPFR